MVVRSEVIVKSIEAASLRTLQISVVVLMIRADTISREEIDTYVGELPPLSKFNKAKDSSHKALYIATSAALRLTEPQIEDPTSSPQLSSLPATDIYSICVDALVVIIILHSKNWYLLLYMLFSI